MELKTGDIILFRTPFKVFNPISYLSASIRFFASIKYNHAGIIIKNWDVPFVNEAVGRGVISMPYIDRKADKIKILRPAFDINEKELAQKANSALGKTPYDFSGLLFWQLLFQTRIRQGQKNDCTVTNMWHGFMKIYSLIGGKLNLLKLKIRL